MKLCFAPTRTTTEPSTVLPWHYTKPTRQDWLKHLCQPIATCLFKLEMNGGAVSSGMGTCGLVGQIGVYTGWVNDVASGAKAAITTMDWVGLVLICFILPALLSSLFCRILRKAGWIKENDLKLDL